MIAELPFGASVLGRGMNPKDRLNTQRVGGADLTVLCCHCGQQSLSLLHK